MGIEGRHRAFTHLKQPRPSLGAMFDRSMLLFAILFPAALAAGAEEPLSRIAFGSCIRQNRPQPIWSAVAEASPQTLLLLGDNVYADTRNMRVMWDKYRELDSVPGFRDLRARVPLQGIWDDHDYGENDAGAEYPRKAESQQIFLDFMRVPPSSPRRDREGIYHAEVFGPPGRRVQILLLDTRYFRSPLKRDGKACVPDPDPDKTLLGEAQWEWLEAQLREPAEVRLVVSSIQVVAEDHRFEKWANFPLERQRLFEAIRLADASGVVFLSGDRHLAELSVMDGGVGYPLFDLTSSSLNASNKEWRPYESNRHRVATLNQGDNFGWIGIDWEARDPEIALEIRDVQGRVALRRAVKLSWLQAGKGALGLR